MGTGTPDNPGNAPTDAVEAPTGTHDDNDAPNPEAKSDPDDNDLPDPTRTERNGRYAIFEFNDGQTLAVPPPPMDHSDISDSVIKAIGAAQSAAKDVGVIRADANLSDQGKDNAAIEPLGRSVSALKQAWAKVEELQAKIDHDRAQLYQVPQLAPSDAAGQLADMEARTWFRGLSTDDRQAVLAKMSGGHLENLALAMKRSPIPLGVDDKLVESAWRAGIDAQHPGEIIDYEQTQRAIHWAQQLMKRTAATLTNPKGAVRAKRWQLVGALKAAHFDPKDVGPFANTMPARRFHDGY
jgi:hypothetical protein